MRSLNDNVYHGLTVCNQAEADEKLPAFLQVPGKKFLSIEPMLEAVDLRNCYFYSDIEHPHGFALRRQLPFDVVILGGETGPGARPLHPDWVRSVRDQCAAAGVPFFFKGWGEWITKDKSNPNDEIFPPFHKTYCWNPDVLPPYPFHRDWAYRVGRNAAGRILDGRTHDDLPWVDTTEAEKMAEVCRIAEEVGL